MPCQGHRCARIVALLRVPSFTGLRALSGPSSVIWTPRVLTDTYAQALSKIVSIVTQQAKGKIRINEDTVLQDDVGLTSLQIMELVFELEEEFDISFPIDRLLDIRTVKELTEAIVTVLDP